MVRLLSILILASTLIGCSGLSAEKPTEIGELTPEQRDGPADYRIAPGDELEIAFFHTPELNTSVIVRPDGKIVHQGEIGWHVLDVGFTDPARINGIKWRFASPRLGFILFDSRRHDLA